MIANIIACNQVTHHSSAIIAVCMNQQCKSHAAACVECLTTIHSLHSKECFSFDKINEIITIINKQYIEKVISNFNELESKTIKILGQLKKTIIEFGNRFDSIKNLTDLNKLRKQLYDYENIKEFQNTISDALIQNAQRITEYVNNTISLIKSTFEADLIKVNSVQCPLCHTSDPKIAELQYENQAIKCNACNNHIICLTCKQNLEDFEVEEHFIINGQFRCKFS